MADTRSSGRTPDVFELWVVAPGSDVEGLVVVARTADGRECWHQDLARRPHQTLQGLLMEAAGSLCRRYAGRLR